MNIKGRCYPERRRRNWEAKRRPRCAWRDERGQSVVEFVFVLPFLLLILIGIAEIGFALYDYMLVAGANREAVRYAARGRYTSDEVFDRAIASGGGRLEFSGDEANIGMIITYININADGSLSHIGVDAAGVVANGDASEPITEDDSQLDAEARGELLNEFGPVTAAINTLREDQDYDPQDNVIVVVETFMMHSRIFDFNVDELPLIPVRNTIPNPMTLYFRSAMRVMRDARDGVGG